jgi:hypothetical protein
MIKRILNLGVFFCGFTIHAQDVKVFNGTPFMMSNGNEHFSKILNLNPKDFSFLTKSGHRKYRVVSLDEDLKVDVSQDLELMEVNQKEVKFVDAGQIGDATYFFSQSFDRKTNEMNLYASDLDIKTGEFKEHNEALKIQNDKFVALSRPFQVIRSVDSSKVLFVCDYPVKNQENATVSVKVTDNTLKEIWKQDIIFDKINRDFTVLEYLVDNKGNIHISASIRMDNDEKRDAGAKGRYYVAIYSYFHETGELKEYEIGFQKEIIMTSHLELNDKDELICTGFYTEITMFDSGMKGFYYLRIDPNSKEVVAKNLSAFDVSFLEQLMSQRKAEKGKGINYYVIRDTYSMPDGGMTIVAENYQYTQLQDDNGRIVSEIWSYGNVLVFFLDAQGNMRTYSILKKNQTCSSKGGFGTLLALAGASATPGANELPYYGIGTMMTGDNLYLIYNENPKNAERVNAGKKPKSVRQATSVTNFVTFKRDGEISSQTLFKSVDKESGYRMPLMPQYHFNYAKNAMLIIGRKGKSARVTQIIVNE